MWTPPLCCSNEPRLSSYRHVLALPPFPELQSNQRSGVLIVTIQLMHPCAEHFLILETIFFFLLSRNCRKYRPSTAISTIVLLLFWRENFSKSDIITLLTCKEWKHFTVWTIYGDHTHSSAQTTRSNSSPQIIKEQTSQLTVMQNTGSVWTVC